MEYTNDCVLSDKIKELVTRFEDGLIMHWELVFQITLLVNEAYEQAAKEHAAWELERNSAG